MIELKFTCDNCGHVKDYKGSTGFNPYPAILCEICGMFEYIMNDISYFSSRNIPLVTQVRWNSFDGTSKIPMLTVENYNKWYKLFIIQADGSIESLSFDDLEDPDYGPASVDHAVNPAAFHLTAIKLGLEYDDRTFAMVCERWVEDVLEDWTELHKYLPQYDEVAYLNLSMKPDVPDPTTGVYFTQDALEDALATFKEKYVLPGLATARLGKSVIEVPSHTHIPSNDRHFKILDINTTTVKITPIRKEKYDELKLVMDEYDYGVIMGVKGHADENKVFHKMEIISLSVVPRPASQKK